MLSNLDVDVTTKLGLGNGTRAVSLARVVVVLFDDYIVALDSGDPSNVARARVGLSNAARDGLVVDPNTGRPCGIVPVVGIAPVNVLVLVCEMDTETLVDAEGDKGGALWKCKREGTSPPDKITEHSRHL